ncbi:MAG: LuxR C-terminal-related transcriptional regulator [Flavobacteriales bacterium]
MSTKLLIVEDDEPTRASMVVFLSGTPGFEIIGVYGTAEEALTANLFAEADVLMTDIGLPGKSGIELIQAIRPVHHRIQCLVLTIFEDDDHVFNALKAGATGYILKGGRPAKILDALDEIISGGSPMTGTIARKVIGTFKQQENTQSDVLTTRENEILKLLAEGFRYKEIADKLDIKTDTVRTHIRNIYQKLEVQSRMEAINKVRGGAP